MQIYKLILALGFIVSILILIVFGYTYLSEHWEECFGPEAPEFCDFDVVSTYEGESIDNKTWYEVDFRLTVKEDMFYVEISPQERSDSITRIISLDEELLYTRTLKAGTVIYPTMSVQLENTYGWVEMQISFIDIDAHKKEIKKTVEIHKYRKR